MEKGPSTFAEYWTSPYAEVNHFYFHGYDMGYFHIIDYTQAAIDFANSNDSENISFTAINGSIYKYNTDTNEFIIISRDGKIVTYFEPDREIEYFYEQFDRHGDYWN